MTQRPSPRWLRLVLVALTAAILGIGLALVIGNLWYIPVHGGEDFRIYLDHTQRWLDGGNYYDARQLTGLPYEHLTPDSLYPPPAAVFFLPYLWLPELVWWIIPLAVIAYALVRLRPAVWSWPLIAACIVAPRTISLTIYGNSTMWAAAAIAAATVSRFPTVFILLKPTFAPFAFFGIERRYWWLGFGAIVVASVAMAPMWSDWFVVIANIRGDAWTHSLHDLAYLAIPLIAYVAATRPVRPLFGVSWLQRRIAQLRTRTFGSR